jgi:hypothetical protein
MNIIDALNLKNPQDYPSREAYQQDVVKAVQVLMRLGIMDNPSADLTASLDSILEKLQEDELAIYGRKRSKQEIIADLKQVNSEIAELDREIADLEWQIALKKAEISVNEPVNTIIRFRDWKQGIFGQGWEATETLLGDRPRSTAGNGLERSKFYDLGVAIVGYAIVLTVELIPDSPTSSQAKVRITTAQGIPYLPPQLKLAILNEDETPALTESVSRERDTWIQREFSLNEGEVFKVKIALNEFSLIETFEA